MFYGLDGKRHTFTYTVAATRRYSNLRSLPCSTRVLCQIVTNYEVVALDVENNSIVTNFVLKVVLPELGPKYWRPSHFDVDATTFQCFSSSARRSAPIRLKIELPSSPAHLLQLCNWSQLSKCSMVSTVRGTLLHTRFAREENTVGHFCSISPMKTAGRLKL